MSGIFPSFPGPDNIIISSITPTRISVTHSLKRHTRSTNTQRWLFEINYTLLSRSQFAPIWAFIIAQDGQAEKFTIIPPAHDVPQGTILGTPLVDGSSQVGKALLTKGWVATQTGILKAGDFIGFTNHTKVYMVTTDADSDSGGLSSISIFPSLVQSPQDSEVLIVSGVPFTVALTDDLVEVPINPPVLYDFRVSFVEDA